MNKWIKVENKLPLKYMAVLAWVVPTEYNTGVGDAGAFALVYYLGDGLWSYWLPDEELDSRLEVVAWQNLPKGYREED